MKKNTLKIGTLGLVLGTTALLIPQADAFFGGGRGITEDSFQTFRQYFVNNDFEGFKTALENFRETRQSDRESRQESINRTVENIDNGVLVTVTSTNQEVVDHLQSKDRPEPQREGILRTVQNIESGVQMTITSDDADLVSHIQDREQDGFHKRGQGMSGKRMRGNGMKRGHQRFNQGEDGNQSSGRFGQGRGQGMNRSQWAQ